MDRRLCVVVDVVVVVCYRPDSAELEAQMYGDGTPVLDTNRKAGHF